MSVLRFFRHVLTGEWQARRRFPKAALDAIEGAIRQSETEHGGEIRFVIEPALTGAALLRNVAPRVRALEVFSQLRVWDTELNNGVLIYVLLADHDVEIVADRGFNGRAAAGDWEAVCRAMETEFSAGRFEAGAITGVRGVSAVIARHFPPGPDGKNELPDRPAFL